MRPDLIVVANPSLRQHLCLIHGVQQLAIQERSAHASVEAFDIAVLPWAAWLNMGCDRTCVPKTFSDFLGGKFASVIASHVLRNPWVNMRSDSNSITSQTYFPCFGLNSNISSIIKFRPPFVREVCLIRYEISLDAENITLLPVTPYPTRPLPVFPKRARA